MIVVDSPIRIDYFNGTISKETDWLDESLGIEPIIMDDIILAQVLQGFQNEKDNLWFKTEKGDYHSGESEKHSLEVFKNMKIVAHQSSIVTDSIVSPT